MTRSISQIIQDTCKKEGIEYESINPDYKAFVSDAVRVGEIVRNIQSYIDELECIFKRYNINQNVSEEIERDLWELHAIDHSLLKLAYKLKENKI